MKIMRIRALVKENHPVDLGVIYGFIYVINNM